MRTPRRGAGARAPPGTGRHDALPISAGVVGRAGHERTDRPLAEQQPEDAVNGQQCAPRGGEREPGPPQEPEDTTLFRSPLAWSAAPGTNGLIAHWPSSSPKTP